MKRVLVLIYLLIINFASNSQTFDSVLVNSKCADVYYNGELIKTYHNVKRVVAQKRGNGKYIHFYGSWIINYEYVHKQRRNVYYWARRETNAPYPIFVDGQCVVIERIEKIKKPNPEKEWNKYH